MLFKKGSIPCNKGKPFPQMLGNTNGFKKGEPGFWLGKKHTEETIEKMKKSHKGQIPWNKGIPQTEETKRKISETLKSKE